MFAFIAIIWNTLFEVRENSRKTDESLASRTSALSLAPDHVAEWGIAPSRKYTGFEYSDSRVVYSDTNPKLSGRRIRGQTLAESTNKLPSSVIREMVEKKFMPSNNPSIIDLSVDYSTPAKCNEQSIYDVIQSTPLLRQEIISSEYSLNELYDSAPSQRRLTIDGHDYSDEIYDIDDKLESSPKEITGLSPDETMKPTCNCRNHACKNNLEPEDEDSFVPSYRGRMKRNIRNDYYYYKDEIPAPSPRHEIQYENSLLPYDSPRSYDLSETIRTHHMKSIVPLNVPSSISYDVLSETTTESASSMSSSSLRSSHRRSKRMSSRDRADKDSRGRNEQRDRDSFDDKKGSSQRKSSIKKSSSSSEKKRKSKDRNSGSYTSRSSVSNMFDDDSRSRSPRSRLSRTSSRRSEEQIDGLEDLFYCMQTSHVLYVPQD